MELLLGVLFAWGLMGFVGLMVLDRHGREGQGFAWGIFFGPIGVLITVVIAANLDREKSDNATRELLPQDIAMRSQMVERAVVAALAVHNPEVARWIANEPASTARPGAIPPDSPPPRTYEEIMASDPKQPPRRFR